MCIQAVLVSGGWLWNAKTAKSDDYCDEYIAGEMRQEHRGERILGPSLAAGSLPADRESGMRWHISPWSAGVFGARNPMVTSGAKSDDYCDEYCDEYCDDYIAGEMRQEYRCERRWNAKGAKSDDYIGRENRERKPKPIRWGMLFVMCENVKERCPT